MPNWKIGSLCLLLVGMQPWRVAALQDPAIQVYHQTGARIEPAGEEMTIPSTAQQILFDIGDPREAAQQPGSRVRYWLEGVDPDWREKTDEMSLTLFFYNSNGDQVKQQVFVVNGRSHGWKGSVEQSSFVHRHEVLTVPPGAERLSVVISSAGPPTTVGVYVVDRIRVVEEGGEQPSVIVDSRPFQEGSGNSHSGWIRTGRYPSMAKMIPMPGNSSSAKAFCILDDDATSYAEWSCPWENNPNLTPGRRLSINWNEIYETGMFKSSRISYPLPQPGRYRFTVQKLDLFGQPQPIKNSVEITVLPPYWKNPWFWGKCALCVAILGFLGDRYRRYNQNRLKLQRDQLVEKERMRIARDLHDDLGARLTHISLKSAFAASQAAQTEPGAKFQEIAGMTRELVTSLSEVVWAVNPANDSLESMVHYLCQVIQRLCQPSALKCRIEESTDHSEYAVSSQVRHNVVLAVKEAVNNAIKHSQGTTLNAKIEFKFPLLTVSIADNGTGLPGEPLPEGNGIKNMQERIQQVNGRIHIESTPGNGTHIVLEVPIC